MAGGVNSIVAAVNGTTIGISAMTIKFFSLFKVETGATSMTI
jgi:hypothetical protein